MTKYLVLIGDGMADLPLKVLKGRTPLEAARTPNLDYLAQNGVCGWTNNTPKELEPGSDVAALSIFGYDPVKYYTGRGPLEAASLGVKLRPGEVAFRCNLVTVKGSKMKDFTADHIATAEARKIFQKLDRALGTKEIKFYPGLSYRNLLVMKDDRQGNLNKLKTKAPHDITGRPISAYLPQGAGKERIIKLMNESEVILRQLKSRATMIWPWGQGAAPKLTLFRQRYGKKAAIITAVHLLKGLGKILGMEVINVPGATGYLDTNYKGKAEYALRALKRNDLVFVHVEAPDEAGHEGDVRKKVRAIEDFDRLVVGTILRKCLMPNAECRIMVLPDHPTPIKYMTHTADDVPFVIYPARQLFPAQAFNERALKKAQFRIKEGHALIRMFLKGWE